PVCSSCDCTQSSHNSRTDWELFTDIFQPSLIACLHLYENFSFIHGTNFKLIGQGVKFYRSTACSSNVLCRNRNLVCFQTYLYCFYFSWSDSHNIFLVLMLQHLVS